MPRKSLSRSQTREHAHSQSQSLSALSDTCLDLAASLDDAPAAAEVLDSLPDDDDEEDLEDEDEKGQMPAQ